MSENNSAFPRVFMVRADFARYAPAFQHGGYVGIGWMNEDLSAIRSREDLRLLYESKYPGAATMNIAQNVGQIWRFLDELAEGTYAVTPLADNTKLMVGQVIGSYYYVPNPEDLPYPHRKQVKWFQEPITRSSLSVTTQNTIRASLTIFQISQADEILKSFIALPDRIKRITMTEGEVKRAILDQILELRADEFEILVREVLAAVGFEEAEHRGRSGDGGIDVTGKLSVYAFASVDIVVQVKRYKSNAIDHKAIKDFRSSVPDRAQAAFVTTSSFTEKARQEAEKDGFKKIGLINGSQFVDILIEHYDDLSEEVREKLNLRKTLIPK